MKLTKTKSHAFGKDTYLLGKDADGDYLWIESASFNCGWYWGFGYVEVYTNNKALAPSTARDISSHSHWEGLVGKQDDGSYKHHANEVLIDSVLNDDESWMLADLMASFYTLRKAAEVFGRGGSHLSDKGTIDAIKDLEMVKNINEIMLPAIFEQVYAILTPTL